MTYDSQGSQTWTVYQWGYAGFIVLALISATLSLAALMPAGTGQAASTSAIPLRSQIRANVSNHIGRILGLPLQPAIDTQSERSSSAKTASATSNTPSHASQTSNSAAAFPITTSTSEATPVSNTTAHPAEEVQDAPEPTPQQTSPPPQPIQQQSSTQPTPASKGLVTFTFDDGWNSQMIAAHAMEQASFRGTFYIVSQQLLDNGFSGFVSRSDVQELAAKGHEIGAHTRTHPHLTKQSSASQRTEIAGSREDLQAMQVGPILSFSYPYGEYNETTVQLVEEAGYSSARTTTDSSAAKTYDPFLLPHQSVEISTSFNEIQAWIDDAIAADEWLILAFHRIDASGDQYSTSPETFNRIVDYLRERGVPVVTISAGVVR